MGRIAEARTAVFETAQALLSMRQNTIEGPPPPARLHEGVVTTWAETGLVISPAQDMAFFARSASWRCTGCGKVHSFNQRVAVNVASPCQCASIEFEPQRELAFSTHASIEQAAAGRTA